MRVFLYDRWMWMATMLLTVLMLPFEDVCAQEAMTGTVSFVTSQNVYLRFDNTGLLQLNDTIYRPTAEGREPCLILLQKSSVSCIAEPIGDCQLNKGDEVVYFYRPPKKKPKEDKVEPEEQPSPTRDTTSVVEREIEKTSKSNWIDGIDGRLSLSNNTTFGEGDYNSRSVGRLSIDAENIGGSKFSFYNYARFRYNAIERNGENRNDSRMSFYELAVQYDPDSSWTISVGRRINNKMMSVGAMDGLHAEKRFRDFYVGTVVGTRTDPRTYGVNLNLLQYGAYVGIYHDKYQSSSTSIGAVDQRNTGATDRRYVFAQHRSRLGDKISLFATAEMDIYQTDTLGNGQTELRPTSLYLMVNYRVTRKLRISGSYDMRRNRILYETYSESVDRLITNDPFRNGYRLRLNYRISRSIFTGAGVSHRAQSDGHNAFTTVNVFLSFARLPLIGGRWSNTFTTNRNTYYQYSSVSTRYTRQFFEGKLSLSPNARYITYDYLNFDGARFNQLYLAMDVYYDIGKNLSIGADYEYSQRGDKVYHRFNTNLIQRF